MTRKSATVFLSRRLPCAPITMQYLIKTALAAFLLAAAALAQAPKEYAFSPVDLPPAIDLIDQTGLLKHAGYLSADELAGRYTGSPGQFKAAEYIAEHFESLGLEPLGDAAGGSYPPQLLYTQHYPILRTSLDREATALTVGEQSFAKGFAVLMGGGNDELDLSGTLIDAGSVGPGGKAKSLKKLAGKLPVVFVGYKKPAKPLSPSRQMMGSYRQLLSIKARATALAEAGAEVVVFCFLDNDCVLASMLNNYSLSPGQDQLAYQGKGRNVNRASRFQAQAPMVFASQKITKILQQAMKKRKAKGRLQLRVLRDVKDVAYNVCAVLRGSDPKLRHEAVIYSAHMDHIGLRFDGDAFNGADDNASGSAGLMEIAQAFAEAKQKPRRSIIFLSVSGEELGLWGSHYYANNPTWPMDDIVANINTDMIGRVGPESAAAQVTVTPSFQHGKYSTIVQDAARFAPHLGLDLVNGDKYYSRSDHINFARQGVPVLFFCSGEHEDYHQVSDHADKLDGAKMEKIARLAFLTGWQVAGEEDRPKELGRQGDWLAD